MKADKFSTFISQEKCGIKTFKAMYEHPKFLFFIIIDSIFQTFWFVNLC